MNKTTAISKKRSAFELVGFAALALILKEVMDPFFKSYAGPASLLSTLALLTFYMRINGQKWSSYGLRNVPGLKSKLLILPQAMLIFITVLVTMVSLEKGLDAAGIHILSEPIEGEAERWGDLKGNLPQYLILLALSWISAGFGEEMFFRGFIITRLQTTLGEKKFVGIVAIIVAALFFGSVHYYYQGLAGFVNASFIGIIFGVYFFLYKRNLWPLIIAHGFINTLGFTLSYLGMAA